MRETNKGEKRHQSHTHSTPRHAERHPKPTQQGTRTLRLVSRLLEHVEDGLLPSVDRVAVNGVASVLDALLASSLLPLLGQSAGSLCVT